jgi:hypothetical protein
MMSEIRFINSDLSQRYKPEAFRAERPFPWTSFSRFLTPEGFDALCRDFPDLRFFEKHENIPKPYNQRPHNRYYLAYEDSIYHPHENPEEGVIRHSELPSAWQEFLRELEGEEYRRFLQSFLDVSEFQIRYAWHIGVDGSEVSPHCDAKNKIATHIFYFNTSDDWRIEWGGETLILCGKRTPALNPDFTDFDRAIPVSFLDNSSYLFKNAPDAWHGVRKLSTPEGKYRKLFNVILTEKPRPAARILKNYVQPLFARLSNSIRRT